MPRLTDTQLVLLSNAAKRDDGALLPLPKRVKIEPRTLTRVLKGLLNNGLVREKLATPEAASWREDPESGRHMLVINAAGLAAIGVEPKGEKEAPAERAKRNPAPKRTKGRKGAMTAPSPGVRPGTKLALMIELLGREAGATIVEIVEATGWQQHSVRGAISGTLKKKLGLIVSSQSEEGRGRVYRTRKVG